MGIDMSNKSGTIKKTDNYTACFPRLEIFSHYKIVERIEFQYTGSPVLTQAI